MLPTLPDAIGDRNIGRLIGGRYRLVAAIGQGGMGAVYRAVHTDMSKPMAVKLLRAELATTDEAARRFEREAEAASRLDHPGCVRVTDFGRADDGALFLVMEHLGGTSLARALAATPRMAPARVVHIAAQLLDAIGHAHALGVVHRDLKPENIMLVPVDGDPDGAKILDFGIARLLAGNGASITETGAVFGTPEYLSPEQALGEAADARADLYAIAVILYEMLAGRRPFVAATRTELLAAHLTREPAPLRQLVPDARLSAELEAVAARGLKKRREERFQSAGEFLDALLAAPAQDLSPGRPGLPAAIAAAAAPPPELRNATAPLVAGPPVAPVVSFVSAEPPPAPEPVWPVWIEEAPASRPAAVAPPHPLMWIVGAGCALILLVVLAVVLSGGGAGDARKGVEAEVAGVQAAMVRGDLAGAHARAESLAHAHPDHAGVFVTLGHVLYARHERVRGLAAYREAERIDRALAAADHELVANLRVTFGDPEHGEAAVALAEKLGGEAARELRSYAVDTRNSALQKRADHALRRTTTASPGAGKP